MVSDEEITKSLNEACAAMQDSGLRVGELQREVRRLRGENNRLRQALFLAALRIDPPYSDDTSST